MRAAIRLALAIPLAFSLSCADMPTAPRAMVSVTGQVLDRDGAPVVAAGVRFQPVDSLAGVPGYGYQSVTDANGRYEIRTPAGRYHVRFYPPYGSGVGTGDIPNVVLGARSATIDYRYRGIRISGSVLGLAGTGESVYITFLSNSGSASFGPTSSTYSLLLPHGPYQVYVDPADYTGGVRSQYFELAAVGADTTVDIEAGGYAVDVTVTRNGAIPIQDAYVRAENAASRASARTNVNGVARLYLPAAWYTLSAHPPTNIMDLDPTTIQIVGDQAVALDLPAVVWSGTLRRASDGAPVENAYVEVTSVLGYGSGSAYTGADAAGAFQVVVYKGRPYDIRLDYVVGYSYYSSRLASGMSSAADTTLDFSVDVPAP